jgi:hypothetical protein
LKVAKAGYYGGDPEKVLRGRIDHVLAIVEYEQFHIDYEFAHYELNKD